MTEQLLYLIPYDPLDQLVVRFLRCLTLPPLTLGLDRLQLRRRPLIQLAVRPVLLSFTRQRPALTSGQSGHDQPFPRFSIRKTQQTKAPNGCLHFQRNSLYCQSFTISNGVQPGCSCT